MDNPVGAGGADVLVVGSGAGGAPVAARLAEAGLDVILLEAGARFEREDFTGVESEMTSKLLRYGVALDSEISVYAGECVGGSTVVNDALCWRTPPDVLESWSGDHGLGGLEARAFAPYLDEAWKAIHAEATGSDHWNRNADRLASGAKRLGWSSEILPRSVRNCANLGLCNFGCPAGAKQSTLVTFVPRAERAGARVFDRTRVRRVLVGGGRVVGVEAERHSRDGASPTTVRFDARTVVVAAGVLETPRILLRSGIERAGRDLQFHTTLPVHARFPEPIHAYFGPTMSFAITEFADVNGATGPGYMIENAAVHPGSAAASIPGVGAEFEERMESLPHLARALVVLRDRTRGQLAPAAGDAIELSYPLLEGDVSRLRHGMASVARAYLAAGAREIYLPLHAARPVRTDAEAAAIEASDVSVGDFTLSYAVHLFGGAPMGASHETSVLREDGSSWDVEGLWVSDASSLPSNTGVNPQITIIANALRIADAIRSDGRTG